MSALVLSRSAPLKRKERVRSWSPESDDSLETAFTANTVISSTASDYKSFVKKESYMKYRNHTKYSESKNSSRPSSRNFYPVYAWAETSKTTKSSGSKITLNDRNYDSSSDASNPTYSPYKNLKRCCNSEESNSDRSERGFDKKRRGENNSYGLVYPSDVVEKKKNSFDNRNSRSSVFRLRKYEELPLEWWDRNDGCKQAKSEHLAKIDSLCDRERLVRLTTLWNRHTTLEPNMFPYDTPQGVEHYTLWSVYDMTHKQIVEFVDRWLDKNMPQVRRWQYDDNSGDRSIDLFHVHVFIETDPFCFSPRVDKEYIPPHGWKSAKTVAK